jgi:endoglucanase
MTHRIDGVSRRTVLCSSLGVASALAAQPAFAQISGAGQSVPKDKRPVRHPNGLKLGVYDPYSDFQNDSAVSTEHLFLPWEDVDLSPLPEADAYALARRRDVLVTIEPWTWARDWNTTPAQLRDAILSGARDENMRAILNVLKNFRSPMTIRWAQEMDNPYARFTWANWRSQDFVAAFRRMAGLTREVTPRAKIMWSPRGEKTLPNYYPGAEFVDVVGLSVFGLEKSDLLEYGHPRTFAEAVRQGYELTAPYGKPVWVAELAYEGSPAYLGRWMADVTAPRPEFPLLKKVVYFNDNEVWPWPHNLGLPRWRVIEGKGVPLRGTPATNTSV